MKKPSLKLKQTKVKTLTTSQTQSVVGGETIVGLKAY